MRQLAFLFPGQGAQYPIMGKDFFDNFIVAKEIFHQADDFLSKHLSKLIFEGSKSELQQTENAQVAIYVVSMAILQTIKKEFPILMPSICAGLSLGEYTALCASGKLSFQDGLRLVQKRASFMEEACRKNPGTMAAVLGLDNQFVEEQINQLREDNMLVWAANFNTPGQVVISGKEDSIQKAGEILKEKGAKRIVPLVVGGAFHSGLMEEAKYKLKPYLYDITLSETDIQIVMNVTGDFVDSPDEIKQNLICQVTDSVRWEQGIKKIDEKGIDLFCEIGPSKTLAGMNKKMRLKASTVSIEKIEDLEKLQILF